MPRVPRTTPPRATWWYVGQARRTPVLHAVAPAGEFPTRACCGAQVARVWDTLFDVRHPRACGMCITVVFACWRRAARHELEEAQGKQKQRKKTAR